MKRQTLVNGLLSLTAISFMTGCVDDKYDLTDIDTTSQFTVKDLTVPVNLSEIKLKNVINLDDNENITIENGQYVLSKGGSIAQTEFKLNGVHVNAPIIAPTNIYVGLGDLAVPPGTFISAPLDLGSLDITPTDLVGYEFKMLNVDEALVWLKSIKTTPINVKVELTIPEGLANAGNKISFENLKLQLPWGLSDVTGATGYDKNTGEVTIPEVQVGANGKAVINITASGLELNDKGEIKNHELAVSGQVGVIGGKINLSVQNITLPNSLDIAVNYEVNAFDVQSFSGKINYDMDIENIAPISLNDLPEFLDNPATNLIIANPEISIDVMNPVGKYGLVGKGKISLTSNFANGKSVERSSDEFKLVDRNSNGMCKIILTPNVKAGQEDAYAFPQLGYVLTNGETTPVGLPESITVGIGDLNFSGDVTDFPLGSLGNAYGDYSFSAPLGFGIGSSVIYETTEADWGSEDLEKVSVRTINLSAYCTTDLPVSIKLSIVPVDKNGNVIAVDEDNADFVVPAKANNVPVTLKIAAKNNGMISGFDGVKFKAIIDQNEAANTEALGPDLHIKLDKLRVTVDGYYETDF